MAEVAKEEVVATISSVATEEKTVFAIELEKYYQKKVSIKGVVIDKIKNKANNIVIIVVKDITGMIRLRIDWDTFKKYQDAFHKSKRVSCSGVVTKELNRDQKEVLTLESIDNVQVLFSFEDNQDNILSEKEAVLLTSRIISAGTKFLSSQNFHQIETKLISTLSCDDGLASLKVVYPGFGEPAYLSTSPSPQLTEFILTAFLDRVFTVSVSFSPTYRSPGMGAEERVILAKAINLLSESVQDLLVNAILYILNELNLEIKLDDFEFLNNLIWDNQLQLETKDSKSFYCLQYNTQIPIYHDNLNTCVNEIYHILDRDEIMLAEAACEELIENKDVKFYTIIIYPNQLLAAIHKKPLRTIRNLWRVGNESKQRR